MNKKILNWETAPEFLYVPEMAQLLRISEVKAYAMCRQADFPCFRIGKSIRISKGNLKEWVKEQSSSPNVSSVL
ncbi:MAG: helix-turn-helix domain-containing protein [Tissierellia bacterium]|nr:helix-turn-helix domain-containing protein [Tissierellia bacterium]